MPLSIPGLSLGSPALLYMLLGGESLKLAEGLGSERQIQGWEKARESGRLLLGENGPRFALIAR